MVDKHHFAVVVPVSGKALDMCTSYQTLVEQKFSINAISTTSPFPHITLCAGEFSNTEADVITMFKSLPQIISPTDICSDGIGVFALESPLIYLRWQLTQQLKQNMSIVYSAFTKLNSDIERHYTPLHWIAKSTLAFRDTSYKQLMELTLLARQHFNNQTMKAHKIALLGYSGGKERCILQLDLN